LAAALAVSALVGAPAAAQVDAPSAKHPKLHARLLELTRQGSSPASPRAGLVRIDADGRVQVYVRAAAAAELLDAIAVLGGVVDAAEPGVIQARVPVTALEALAARPDVSYVEPPIYARPQLGRRTTEGDAVIRADAARRDLGVTGRGVRVGVISLGLAGLAESIATGDLPPTTFHCRTLAFTIVQRTTGCVATEKLVETSGGVTGRTFAADEDLTAAGDAEGTAMLEIIRDLAPDAELWFAGGLTSVEVTSALRFLAANVDVVVSDLGFAQSFPDGQSFLSRVWRDVIADPTSRARAYVQSAGNAAQRHYAARYTNSGVGDFGGNLHLFARSLDTTGPGSSSTSNRVTVPPGGTILVFLSWDDPPERSENDYDLELRSCQTGGTLADSTGIQNGAQDPTEGLVWTNPLSGPVDACVVIVNVFNRAAARTLNLVFDGSGSFEYQTAARSLQAPADAIGDLIAVGAVPAGLPTVIEPYSSRGPTFDGRIKPDLVAPDLVSVSGAGGFPSPFPGTSAAAPHVAGVAALVREANPGLGRTQLLSILKQTAVPLGDANTFGAGRVDAFAAVSAARALLPALAVMPVGAVDLGPAPLGQSADRLFVVSNIGGAPLSGSATATAPFTVVAGGSYSLAPGAGQVVTVRFTPTSTTTVAGSVSFSGAAGATRAVTGTGVASGTSVQVTLNPSHLQIGQFGILSVQARNPTGNPPADLYVGVLTPDLTTVLFLTRVGAALELSAAAVTAPAQFRTLDPLAAGSTIDFPTLVQLNPPAGAPLGTYRVFGALVRQGALADNRIDPGDVLAVDVEPVTVSP
jgi:hypothetical protein